MSSDIESAFPGMKRFSTKCSRRKKRKMSEISIQFSDVTKAKCKYLNKDTEQPTVHHNPADAYVLDESSNDDWEYFFGDDTHEDQG
jgi:hypothetical protein